MLVVVRFLGIFITVFAIVYLLNPNIIKPYMAFWKRGKRMYMGGAASLLIGIILLLAASQCRVSGFIAAFGILALIKGIALLILKPEKTIPMLDWWVEKPITFLRGHALLALVLGALLIYCA